MSIRATPCLPSRSADNRTRTAPALESSGLIRVDQLRHLPCVRPLHGPAVARGGRRLADSIDGKHGGVDGPAVGLETQGGMVDAAFGIHFDAPLVEFVGHSEFE